MLLAMKPRWASLAWFLGGILVCLIGLAVFQEVDRWYRSYTPPVIHDFMEWNKLRVPVHPEWKYEVTRFGVLLISHRQDPELSLEYRVNRMDDPFDSEPAGADLFDVSKVWLGVPLDDIQARYRPYLGLEIYVFDRETIGPRTRYEMRAASVHPEGVLWTRIVCYEPRRLYVGGRADSMRCFDVFIIHIGTRIIDAAREVQEERD